MARQMPLPVYYYWLAYAELEPFGQGRQDWRIAMQTAELINVMTALWAKRPTQFTAENFMIEFGQRFRRGEQPIKRDKKTPEEMYGMIRTAALLSGAKDPKIGVNEESDGGINAGDAPS